MENVTLIKDSLIKGKLIDLKVENPFGRNFKKTKWEEKSPTNYFEKN